jgi:lipoprotein-releasing system permease protein
MRFPLFIARRYFLAKKSHNIINLVSGISLVGVMIGSMALITVLSVFNGFESLVVSLFNSFNPDYQITAKKGKTFEANAIPWDQLSSLTGVKSISPCLEDKALVKYRSKQLIIALKGVEPDYGGHSGLDTMLVDGEFVLERNKVPFAICGYGVAYQLEVSLNDFIHPLEIYYPRKGNAAMLNPAEAFNFQQVAPAGVFSVQQEFDATYVIVPLSMMAELLETPEKLSSVEVRTERTSDNKTIKTSLEQMVGDHFIVKDKFQQEEILFKIMRSEKWVIFLILTFILIIAVFNVIGSITMLILEKKKDISILFSLGAGKAEIRKIFLFEGWMISIIGAILGLLAGFILCYLQKKYGIISLGGDPGAFLIQAYPVKMKVLDFMAVFFTVIMIGFVAAWLPAKRISQRYMEHKTLST